MFIDAIKAHAYATCDDPGAYIELPPEDAEAGKRAKLKRWLHGTRGAAHGWETEWPQTFLSVGYEMGKSAPTVVRRDSKDMRCVAHGDDLTFIGTEGELKDIAKKMGDLVRSQDAPNRWSRTT